MKKTNYRCPKCGELLYTQTEYGDYSYQCLQCDEDFFAFEAVFTEGTVVNNKKRKEKYGDKKEENQCAKY